MHVGNRLGTASFQTIQTGRDQVPLMEICVLDGNCLVQIGFKVLNIADRGELVQSLSRPLIFTERWLYYFVRLAFNKGLHRLDKVDSLIEHLLFECQVTLS